MGRHRKRHLVFMSIYGHIYMVIYMVQRRRRWTSFGPALIGVGCLVRVKLFYMKCMLPRQARAVELMMF